MGTYKGLIGIAFLATSMTRSIPLRGAEVPEPHEDPAKIRDLVAAHIADLEGTEVSGNGGGLKVTAFLLPDAMAYRIARAYLSRREEGDSHDEAVRGVSKLLPGWKRREGMAAVKLKIENPYARPGDPADPMAKKRVFTLQNDFVQEGAVLLSASGKQVPARLAETPLNIRVAQLRKKMFWTTEDGATRGRAYDPDDPASIGRKPKLSKPFQALLIEDKTAEAELLFKAKTPKDLPQRLVLQGFKRYEGPFEKDQIDLNGGRRWEPVEPITVDLRQPPGGTEPPAALVRLVKEVKEAQAAAKVPAPKNPKDSKKKA